MKKLVCESLDELYVNKLYELNDDHGSISGAIDYVKKMPARWLRKKRAKSVMEKYKVDAKEKIDTIINSCKSQLKNLKTEISKNIEPKST